MFESVSIEEISKHITFAGKSSVFKEDNTIPDLQAKGVTALCKILNGRQYAYLADEVGMGKTYQAIGVIAMLLAEKKNANILIIAPNEAVQRNWRNEINNFFKKNLLFDSKLDLDKEVEVIHPVDIIKNYALENKKAKISIVRLTAFSTIGEKVAKQGNSGFSYGGSITSRQLCYGLTAVTGNDYSFVPYEAYNSYEAGMICGSAFRKFSPQYDLVIVDEAQNIRNYNNATAFFNYWMGLKKFKTDPNTKVGVRLEEYEKEAPRKRSCKYLLLSATPAHRGVESLRNQLLYFENSKNIPVIDHSYLEQFMIRRLRTYSGSSKYAIRNITAKDVAKDLDVEKRLFLALVQSRLAQIQASNNSTFKIGFLETFESYDASGDENGVDDETGEKGKEFENGGSSEVGEKGAALDKSLLKSLAKSYSKAFNGEKCPPHPKLDFMADEMGAFIKNNLSPGVSSNVPDKSIVFVRRLASVDELVNRRLNRIYEDEIVSYWGNRLGLKDAKLIDVQRSFETLYKKTIIIEDDEDITEESFNDEGNISKSPLIAWMSVKKTDKSNPFSCVSLFKKSMMRNKPNCFLFDENYYRTAHADETDDKYKKRLKRLVNDDFEKEINEYVQADFSRYIQGEKKHLNYSYLLALCCYVALKNEQHPMAEELKKYFKLSDRVESNEIIIKKGQIIKILNQTSLWNCLRRGDKESNALLDAWFNIEMFSPREALKKCIEKYLKSSEAILEILYCYCNLRDRNNRNALCREIWKILYSRNCSHGLRIRQLLCEDTANLICNQLLGGAEIDDFTYDPAFMNNQQWVMPATGGNKGNEALIKRFNTPFYPDVIVCTDVLKEGINLHLFCNRVYHYGLAWTPGDLEQRIGRVDRFFSKTHRERLAGEDTHVEVGYPYMGKSVDEQQLRKVLQFKLSADPLLDSNGEGRKDIEVDLTDSCTVEELAKYVPSKDNQTNFPYSGELFWGDDV